MCNYNKNPEVNNLICEAVGCVARATDKIRVKAGAQKAISLLLCNECISKFQTSIEARDESSYQSRQYEDGILQLNDECSFACRLLEDARAEIEELKAEHSSGGQNKKKALEEVGSQNSNADLCVSHPLNAKDKENDTKYGFTEDRHKPFDGDSISE